MNAVDAGEVSLREWFWFEILWPVIFVFVVAPVMLVLRVLRSKKAANRFLCLLTAHDWADEHRYGVQPVCLQCNKQRDDT